MKPSVYSISLEPISPEYRTFVLHSWEHVYYIGLSDKVGNPLTSLLWKDAALWYHREAAEKIASVLKLLYDNHKWVVREEE